MRTSIRVVLPAMLAIAIAGVVSVALLTARAHTAAASPSTAITITTQLIHGGNNHGTFEASSPLCATGTFVDDIVAAGANGLLVRKTLTCDDGSGTFVIEFHPQFPRSLDGGTPWSVLSGTGAYATLHGGGNYTLDITGPTTGIETFSGVVHFD